VALPPGRGGLHPTVSLPVDLHRSVGLGGFWDGGKAPPTRRTRKSQTLWSLPAGREEGESDGLGVWGWGGGGGVGRESSKKNRRFGKEGKEKEWLGGTRGHQRSVTEVTKPERPQPVNWKLICKWGNNPSNGYPNRRPHPRKTRVGCQKEHGRKTVNTREEYDGARRNRKTL